MSATGRRSGAKTVVASPLPKDQASAARPRNRCDCAARLHPLFRNCLSCGRIACEKEGSGPCFHCQALLCTRDEEQAINTGSKRGRELRERLMQACGARDALLSADRDNTRRTKIIDLDFDFATVSNNAYLTQNEREAIEKRKRELEEIKKKASRQVRVSIDVTNRRVDEINNKLTSVDLAKDERILAILEGARQRQQKRGGCLPTDNAPDAADLFRLQAHLIPASEALKNLPKSNLLLNAADLGKGDENDDDADSWQRFISATKA